MKIINTLFRRIIDLFGSIRLALGTVVFIGMTIAIGALFLFGWLASEILEGDTLRFDNSVRAYVHEFASPALTTVMQTASFLGSTLFLTITGIGVFFVFYFLQRRRPAIIFAITTIGATILLVSLKLAFKRARPEPFFDTILPASFSFPSGHSLASFCFYGALAAIITVRINNRTIQTLIWTAAVILVLLIGISRIYLGVHYPSDVLAGYAIGLIWVVTIAIGDKLIHARDQSVIERDNRNEAAKST